mmetsp:Transcript_10564/g.32949  ORF Transcript_10564/g.32949 Transcript_10564/m.32949 type:complete len:234 (+) Transcript_10564:407-1108(+)
MSPCALQRGRLLECVLKAPACTPHQHPPLVPLVPCCGAVVFPALPEHGWGIPLRHVRREVGEGQAHDAAAPGAVPRARWVPARMLPAQAVDEPGPSALHWVVATPSVPEDLVQCLVPEGVLPDSCHDCIADEPRGPLLEKHGVDEVLFPQEHTSTDPSGRAQEAIQAAHRFDVDVCVDAPEHVEDRDARDIRALDARHAVVLASKLREVLHHECSAPSVVPKLETPVWVQPAP